MTRYAMAIDLKNCIGCHACSVACKMNNNLPVDLWYNRVITDGGAYMDTASGTYPDNLHREHYPVTCQHCSNPACVEVCPTGASYVAEDGTVQIDQETCIGCNSCAEACPYEVRTLLAEEPAYVLDFAMGDWDAPAHKANVMEKCTFCSNRRARGEAPACMDLCLGRARYWGDADDPNSEISQVLASRDYERLLESEGTEPNCYYLK